MLAVPSFARPLEKDCDLERVAKFSLSSFSFLSLPQFNAPCGRLFLTESSFLLFHSLTFLNVKSTLHIHCNCNVTEKEGKAGSKRS